MWLLWKRKLLLRVTTSHYCIVNDSKLATSRSDLCWQSKAMHTCSFSALPPVLPVIPYTAGWGSYSYAHCFCLPCYENRCCVNLLKYWAKNWKQRLRCLLTIPSLTMLPTAVSHSSHPSWAANYCLTQLVLEEPRPQVLVRDPQTNLIRNIWQRKENSSAILEVCSSIISASVTHILLQAKSIKRVDWVFMPNANW